jgi:hypothetical protein
MEAEMAFLTADVVEDPDGELPFKVVIKQGETVLGEWAVESQADGEQQLVELVRDAIEEQGSEGEEEDDDNGDEDDDDRRGGRRRRRDDDDDDDD